MIFFFFWGGGGGGAHRPWWHQSGTRRTGAVRGLPTSAAGAGQGGNPVVSAYINHEKRFAFVEFRTIEEASNALALDGVGYRGEELRVRPACSQPDPACTHCGVLEWARAAGVLPALGLLPGVLCSDEH